tara:strand:+ start:131 stop:610 length:480 start_codon:yes stop_codon:yes gene_type:complete
MKTFKEHLAEHSGGAFKRQWDDQDTMPSAQHALEALNSLVGQVAEHEYLNPKVGIEILGSQLGKLGYHFEAPTLDGGEGQYSMPLSYGAGTFEADRSENPYGEFKEGDGISDHIEGGVSLVIDVMKSGDGKSLMNAQIVRNSDAEKIAPVDKIKVKDKG